MWQGGSAVQRLMPSKLQVEFRGGVTPTEPIVPRKYTLTHSDLTGELFLVVAPRYAQEKVTRMRDEVLAEWREATDGQRSLWGSVFVGGPLDPGIPRLRYSIFQRELPLALEAIRYGDRALFASHPELDQAPVFVQFESTPAYTRVERFGTLADYA